MQDLLKRAYTGKDADMLTAAGTIIENALANKDALVAKRAKWADPFFPNLQMRISRAFPEILGFDNAGQLRAATQLVNSISADSLNDLSFFKVQVEQDFRSDKVLLNDMLTSLGFIPHFRSARTGNQGALVELLFKFKTNMTPALRTRITDAGTSTDLITSILSYSDRLASSNISQEALKGSRRVITQANLRELNDIYTQVISIARISAKLFKNQPAISQQFSYAKVLSTLRGGSSSGNTGTGNTGSGTDNEIQPV